MKREDMIRRIEAFPGHTSVWFKDLTTGEICASNAKEPMCAASVIKLTVMAELFRRFEAGELDRDLKLTVKDEDRVPICGVLTLMHAGMEVTPVDLCWLMIAISDNMATNLLIDLLGMENIQANNRKLGLEGVELNRKLFDWRPGYRDKTNFITAESIGKLLEMIWEGELVSKQASKEMMDMLLAQQCTNKMPLFLGEEAVAHKTGEQDGVTHDVGIVFAKRPFIACFCNWKLEEGSEGRMNLLIGESTKVLFDQQGGAPEEAHA